jgi:hypothetical protein
MRRTVVTEDARIETGHPVDEVQAELLSAMSLFDKFPLIALQRASLFDSVVRERSR